MEHLKKEGIGESLLSVLASAAVSIVTYFTPVLGLIALIAFVALVDHFFGVWRVKQKKERLERWKGIKKTFSKIVAYTAVIAVAFVFDRNLMNELSLKLLSTKDVFSKVLTLALCFHEWKSINRNFKEVKGVSLWERILEFIGGARKVIEEGAKVKKLMFLAVVFLVSCTTQKNAIKRHYKIVEKFPFVHTVDSVTLVDTVTVTLEKVTTDTLIRSEVTKDTVTLEKERLKIKYYNNGETVYLWGNCDTVVKEIPVVRKVPVVHYEKPLKWYQKEIAIALLMLAAFGIGFYLSKMK